MANNFLVSKLKCHCAEYLDRHLDARNCLAVKELATRYNMTILAKTAENYLLLNPNECVELAEDAEKYPLFRVETLISDHTLRLRGDVQLQFIIKWINADLQNRHMNFKVDFIQLYSKFIYLGSITLRPIA